MRSIEFFQLVGVLGDEIGLQVYIFGSIDEPIQQGRREQRRILEVFQEPKHRINPFVSESISLTLSASSIVVSDKGSEIYGYHNPMTRYGLDCYHSTRSGPVLVNYCYS